MLSVIQGRDGGAAKSDRRLSYAWVVTLVAALGMFTTGNFQYIFGVFFRPLIDTFGWSRAAISGSVSLRNIVTAALSPLAGSLSDRLGARRFILAGAILIGLSYLLISQVSELWELYLFLGLITGLGISMFVVPSVATVTRWFGGKSAVANGIVFSGFSLAQVVLPPVATVVILNQGWSTCFLGFAALAWLGGIVVWYFIRVPAEPALKTVLSGSEVDTATVSKSILEENHWTLAEALRTPALLNLLACYVVVAICYQVITIHIVAAAMDAGISATAAAIVLTIAGITNTSGRLAISTVTARLGNKKVLNYCLAAQGALLFLLAGAHSISAFYLIAAAYGLFYGGVPPMMPTIAGEYFGTKSIGGIFGMMTMAYTIGGAIGPLAAGYIFDITGRYYLAFVAVAVAMTLAFFLSLTLKPPQRRKLT
ncbi:MAG: MFS transporter [Dehalococcoidales bacterium]|nr:MFS transporter [Dehalococcoidales bacterium]